MHWKGIFTVLTLSGIVGADFTADANALLANHKSVRLDPILRRALLKALTELEEEAQEKARLEEEAANSAAQSRALSDQNIGAANDGDSQFQDEIQSIRQDEIQNTADSTYPTPNPLSVQETNFPNADASITTVQPDETTTLPDTNTALPVTIKDTFFFQTPTPLDGDKAKIQKASELDIETNLISDDKEVKQVKIEASTKTPNLPQSTTKVASENEVDIFKAPLVAAFTLHQDSRGTPHSIIPIYKQVSQHFQQVSQSNQQQFQQQAQLAQQQFQFQSQPLQVSQQILQQPQQPLFQRQTQFQQNPQQQFQQIIQPQFSQNTLSGQLFQQQQQNFQQFPFQQQNQGNFGFGQQFSNQFRLPQNQFSVQQIPIQSQFSQSFQPSVGPFGTNANTVQQPQVTQFDVNNGQQQLPSLQPASAFQAQGQQQPVISSGEVTPGSQHLNSNPAVDFPSSTAFPPFTSSPVIPSENVVSSTPSPIQSFSSTSHPLTAISSTTAQTTFTIPAVTLPLQNEQRFQSPIVVQQPSEQTRHQQNQFNEQAKEHQKVTEQTRLRQLEEQARFRQLEQLNRQRDFDEERLRSLAGQGPDQLRAQRQQPPNLTFQRSIGFAINPNPFHQFQPTQQHVRSNRQEGFGSTGNFGFNDQQYRTIPDAVYRQQVFRRSPQQQLAQLLFQSGVGTGPAQEDLNIVSKVLALNHERSDAAVDEKQRTFSTSSLSQPINVPKLSSSFQPISRLDPESESQRSGRSTEEKTLLVGEIKDFTGAR